MRVRSDLAVQAYVEEGEGTMTVPNPLQESLHDFAVLLGGHAVVLLNGLVNRQMTGEAVKFWEQDRRLRGMIQKLWDAGSAWGYERAMSDIREQDEARDQTQLLPGQEKSASVETVFVTLTYTPYRPDYGPSVIMHDTLAKAHDYASKHENVRPGHKDHTVVWYGEVRHDV